MKYKVEIVDIGDLAKELLEEKMIILFNSDVNKDLAEISVLHTISKLNEDIIVGDNLTIGNSEYIVTAVGKEANKSIRDLGHCTLKFNGLGKADLPGVINLKGKIPDLKIGNTICIY